MTLQQQLDELGDVVPMVSKYLEGVQIGPDDSYNIAGFEAPYINTNFGWNIPAISKPTLGQLQALKAAALAEQAQHATNKEAQAFLDSTDWQILRHKDQQDLGIATSLTAQEFQDLLQLRQMARSAVVR